MHAGVLLACGADAGAFEGETLQQAIPSVVSVLPVLPAAGARSDEPEGSGVAIHDGRQILTAMHVIEGADEILIRTADGDVVAADLVGGDPFTDIAVLQVETALPPLPFRGDAVLGEPVCAVGNAFGLGLTIACGVVSGVHMAGIGFNPIEDFVQTDAAINPGVSGGALIDGEGRMVGLVSAIFTKTSDANIGINFAVAMPLVERVVDAILETGRYQPPRTGVRLGPWPPAGEEGRMSASVLAIEPGSPAEFAGLHNGDRVIRAAGRRVRGPADFVSAVGRLGPEAELEIEVERDGRPIFITVELTAGIRTDQ